MCFSGPVTLKNDHNTSEIRMRVYMIFFHHAYAYFKQCKPAFIIMLQVHIQHPLKDQNIEFYQFRHESMYQSVSIYLPIPALEFQFTI